MCAVQIIGYSFNLYLGLLVLKTSDVGGSMIIHGENPRVDFSALHFCDVFDVQRLERTSDSALRGRWSSTSAVC
jgi:hypothetical protein